MPGEAARSAQLHAWLLTPFLKANGIKSVINLRGAHPEFGWWRREERACRAAGVVYLNAMLDSRLLPTRPMLCALWDCFAQAKAPVLIKCSGGQDRTSLAAALYLIERRGWGAMDQALGQFARFPFLHFPKREQSWLKAFPLYARQRAGGVAPRNWIETSYDPRDLAAWLEEKLGPGRFKGIYAPGAA